MKKRLMVAVVLAMSFALGSCTDAEVVSQNLSKAADQTTEAPTTTVVETTTTTAAPTTTTLRPEDQYLREARSRFTGGDDEIYLALGDLACTVLSLSDESGDFEGAALMSLIVAEVETELPPEVIGEATLLASQHLCSEYEGISDDIVDLYLSVASSEEDEGASESGLTRSQENAIQSAESYLRHVGGFSRQSLIEQLEYEGFSTDEAIFAVDSLDVDWNEQAYESAESYLEHVGGFSRSGLIEQLESEGFTREQATYAVDKAGL